MTKDGFIRTADGIRIHYVEAGEGQPIVFVPGWLMPCWIWEKQIKALSKKYRVLAVDPRSQGESDKPNYGHLPETRAHDYRQLVDQLDLQKPVLVGWSMGCGELLSYVEQFGDSEISGLVMVDGMIPVGQNPEGAAAMSRLRTQVQRDHQKAADDFVRGMYLRPQPEEYLQRVIQAALKTPTDTAATLLGNMLAVDDFSKAFANVDCSLLFAYEPALQPNADFLKAKFGDKLQSERFDGDGHALYVDDPKKFNRMIEKFVQNLPGGQR